MNIILLYLVLCYDVVTSSASYEKMQNKEVGQVHKFPDWKDSPKGNLKEIATDLSKDYTTFINTSTKGKTPLFESASPVESNVDYKVGVSDNRDSNSRKSNTLSMEVGKHVVKVSSVLLSKDLEINPKATGNEISVNPKFGHVIEIFPNDDDREKWEMQHVNENPSEKTDNSELPTDSRIFEEINLSSQMLGPSQQGENDESAITLSSEKEDELAFFDSFEGSGEETFTSADSEEAKAGRLLDIFSRQNDTAPTCETPKGEAGHCRTFSHCLLSNALNNFNIFLQYLCLIRGALVGMCCPDNPVIEITHPDEDKGEINDVMEIKQPAEGCGLNTKTRIVGGAISVPHEWTWMVALMRRNRFFCGGVIINNWYILTAAHCVMGTDVKDLTVRLGEYNFTTRHEHKEDISVAEIKRHSQFVTLTFQHDIALLKLRNSVRYSKFIGSICLPSQNSRDYSDVNGTVVGWGTVSFGGAASPVLRQVTVPVWRNEDCDQTYVLENISDAFLCAGSPEKGEDACQGDSGGPLMTLNDRGRWEVIGLVSWGRRCGDPTYPGVYTRVTTYLDWIAQNAV